MRSQRQVETFEEFLKRQSIHADESALPQIRPLENKPTSIPLKHVFTRRGVLNGACWKFERASLRKTGQRSIKVGVLRTLGQRLPNKPNWLMYKVHPLPTACEASHGAEPHNSLVLLFRLWPSRYLRFCGCDETPGLKSKLGREGLVWFTLPGHSLSLEEVRTGALAGQDPGGRADAETMRGAAYWLVSHDLLSLHSETDTSSSSDSSLCPVDTQN